MLCVESQLSIHSSSSSHSHSLRGYYSHSPADHFRPSSSRLVHHQLPRRDWLACTSLPHLPDRLALFLLPNWHSQLHLIIWPDPPHRPIQPGQPHLPDWTDLLLLTEAGSLLIDHPRSAYLPDCSGSPACLAWFGSPTHSGRSHSSACWSCPFLLVSLGRRLVTPTHLCRQCFARLACRGSAEHLASRLSLSHHRTLLASSSSSSH